MSKAVEEGSKAVLENFLPPTDLKPSWHLNPETVAKAALLAALPTLTEDLDEVLAQISTDYSVSSYAFEHQMGPDPKHWTEFFANALVEKLKERIES